MSLTVLEPGPCSLVVDLGRPNHRSLGVPLGGAADRAALIQGNALVGNPPGAAALEFALVGPTLKANVDIGCIVFGAPFQLAIDGRAVKSGTTFNLHQNEVLKIGTTSAGMRGFLCVNGGLQVKELLGSRSAWGPIAKRQQIECGPNSVAIHSLADPVLNVCDVDSVATLRIIDGPQADWFDPDQFYQATYTITPASNRMGLRLQGTPLNRPMREMVSEAVCPGTVQVVNDGQCIVLGVDGQTIGGYPKVATVISADLDMLGQLRPGQQVRFERVTMELAESLQRDRQRRLKDILLRLQVAG